MFRKPITIGGLLVICLFSHPLLTRALPPIVTEAVAGQRQRNAMALPDLKIRQYQFAPGHDEGLRVQVANYGSAASAPCRLELTIRRIEGTPVGRTMYQVIPAIQPRDGMWITLDTTKILPTNVSLQDTTFQLIADATNSVVESDEHNNESWHNLQ